MGILRFWDFGILWILGLWDSKGFQRNFGFLDFEIQGFRDFEDLGFWESWILKDFKILGFFDSGILMDSKRF